MIRTREVDPPALLTKMSFTFIFILNDTCHIMDKKSNKAEMGDNGAGRKRSSELPGYPLYPADEDIFSKFKEEGSLNPEDTSRAKAANEAASDGKNNEKSFDEDRSGGDLDVPGSETDEKQEFIGTEDEENSYYSLGGDDHNDLDEDTGE
jgi:hypothetical protein